MYQIALDGPPGTGKSTLGKALAKKLNIMYLDSGALYRAFALHCLNFSVNTDDIEEVKEALASFDVFIDGSLVTLCGKDVTDEIRKQYVADAVKFIAATPEVRGHITEVCRKLAGKTSVVMDGRDIATNILPDAEFKYYLVADLRCRAERRCKELKDKGEVPNFDEILKAIQTRENTEKTRPVSPLVMHKDAVMIDTSDKSVEEIVALIEKDIEKASFFSGKSV